jgi:hypothetical protein
MYLHVSMSESCMSHLVLGTQMQEVMPFKSAHACVRQVREGGEGTSLKRTSVEPLLCGIFREPFVSTSSAD